MTCATPACPRRWSLTPGRIALVASVKRPADLAAALAALGLAGPRPVLVLVGGAAGLDPDLRRPLLDLLRALIPVLDEAGAVVVDGGTRSGVMALMGEAAAGSGLPLLGVTAEGTLRPANPGHEGTARPAGDWADPDPSHGHFLLVPGRDWGDESPWIAAAASVLAGDLPSLTLMAGGGEVTARDLAEGLRLGRPTLILAGTGGTADAFAAYLSGTGPCPFELPPRAAGLLDVMDLNRAAADLPTLVRRLLGQGPDG